MVAGGSSKPTASQSMAGLTGGRSSNDASSPYSSLPSRVRSQTTDLQMSSGSYRGGRSRVRTFSIDIQDPRQRRLSRNISEQSIARGGTNAASLQRAGSSKRGVFSYRAGAPSSGSINNTNNKGGKATTALVAADAESGKGVDGTGGVVGDGDGQVDGADGDQSEELEKEPELSRFSMFALTINFIIGVGVLDLPFIFYEAGVILCSVLVIFATLGSNLAGNYVLETQSRGIMRSKVCMQTANADVECRCLVRGA